MVTTAHVLRSAQSPSSFPVVPENAPSGDGFSSSNTGKEKPTTNTMQNEKKTISSKSIVTCFDDTSTALQGRQGVGENAKGNTDNCRQEMLSAFRCLPAV
eukprot:4121554-Amphidinium_carterae.1